MRDHIHGPVDPPGRLRGLGIDEFRLHGGFWGGLQARNSAATLQHCLEWMERLGWIANFDRVAEGATAGPRPGWQFSDSEVYKLMEALAWEHGRTGAAWADETLASLTERVAAAQDDDGYVNTCYGHAGQADRYSDLSAGHELYCTGHLLQAAVARVRTAGEDKLVEVARRAADHVCREFGEDGRDGICGHPEIEVGLAELGRALNEPRYTEQARLFLERRGRGTLKPIALLDASYFQDDMPIREADAWRGHAVRALYLAAGAIDVAVDTDDADLLAAVERQWTRSVERRTYLTGGMGSRHQDEGFGEDWELPPDRAYCETCAGIASVMVSWRLYLATGDVRYADLMERTFYNVIAASPSEDGRAFFYANPLQQRSAAADVRPDEVNPRAEGGVRAPWFDVSCCPTNLARTLASWQAYAAAVDGDAVSLLQYASGDLTVRLDSGDLTLRIDTAYPHEGAVRIEVVAAPEGPAELRLRVPHWAEGAAIADATGRREAAPGWAEARGPLHVGATIELHLPVEPRFTWPDERIDAVRGCVAVERGPLVLCAESIDLPWPLESLRVDATHPPRTEGDGAVLQATAMPPAPEGGPLPYRSTRSVGEPITPAPVRLIPYHRWAQRGSTAMRVFLPTM
ncbi:glycoside hydrolase family 127 protein [Glycomyces sp. TRM65418]|uniref:glycoside hydrolase family 127 protein n=1 Tax=Glycomyces sp. TRM65418 TaxID=2867006 RepID=UPI001CE5F684|nr:beta-L-arabinofuranosidase domain-containing protein [Glycomyces sp. TRM65418]MCC3765630.1 glycoside hydrolase family 127 protein [Glycomyces sp. TRM65418]QZD55229.1 glycoside hydrolase family 127 protein [Glycomyces sp. TRM65418]